MENIKINTEFIKLDSFLKWCGAADLGSYAKMFIQNGEVKVNGEVCLQRGKKLKVNDLGWEKSYCISMWNEKFIITLSIDGEDEISEMQKLSFKNVSVKVLVSR